MPFNRQSASKAGRSSKRGKSVLTKEIKEVLGQNFINILDTLKIEELTTTDTKGDRKVAGVVSENPAHLMNSGLEGEHVTPLALQGRTPCMEIGKVETGDIIVTSAIAGYGMVDNNPTVGTVIGKAVGKKDDDGKGIVEVVVGRV